MANPSTTRNADEVLGVRPVTHRISFVRLIWAAPVAVALAAAAIFVGYRFPVWPLPLVASLVLYAGILWREPRLWLFFVPALLPILNLAPWSGRFFIDEFDLFLLVTVAIWCVRGRSERPARFAPGAAILVSLFFLAFCASLAIGVLPLESIDINGFSNYFSKYNGLRVAKGLGWGVVLMLIARSNLAGEGEALNRYWVPGMLVGFAGVITVAIWERVAFPGLANLAQEYRITATFGSMHVGGAAIDGYLALAIPFTLAWMTGTRSPLKIVTAGALFVLGTYTIIATFSRGLYMAYLVMILMFAFGTMVRQKATGTFSTGRAIFVVISVLVLTILCFGVFASGGYRALGAVLGVIGIAFFLGGKAEKRSGSGLAFIGIVMLLAINFVLLKLFDKGAYLAYGISFLISVMGTINILARPHTSQHRLAWSGLVGAMVAAVLVANHWGGTAALMSTTMAIVFVLLLLVINRVTKRPLWRPNVKNGVALGFVGAIFFASIPIAGNSYFVGERFSDRSSAVRARLTHWRDALGMIDHTLLAKTFGMGVGRFPGVYFWRSQVRSPSGTFQLVDEVGNRFLKLGGHREGLSSGATLFYAQRIDAEPHQVLNLSFDARSSSPKARIHIGICESMLLYAQNCETKGLPLAKTDGTWNRLERALNTRGLGAWRYYGKRPVQIWFVNPLGGTEVDIDNARLTDAYGNNLLHNGDFTRGGDRWLFSVSDFWPWHIENIWIHFLFEQGWIGLLLFVVLFIYALCRLLVLASRGQFLALVMFVSFTGFAIVGSLNSLFEFPRVALLFYLMLFFSLLRWKVEEREPAPRRSHDETNRSSGNRHPASPEGASRLADRPAIARSRAP